MRRPATRCAASTEPSTLGGVSIVVPADQLADAVARYGFAYLVTVGDDGRPHVVAVSPEPTADGLLLDDLGRRTRANATARPEVTLVWPPGTVEAFSLIVDGVATPSGDTVVVAPSRAVLHRPAPAPGPAPTAAPTASRSEPRSRSERPHRSAADHASRPRKRAPTGAPDGGV